MDETGLHGSEQRGYAEICSSKAALSATRKYAIKHIFISDLPPLCH
jgi:hypothetical protein